MSERQPSNDTRGQMGAKRMMEPPGLRAEGGDGFHAAYFRDLDGNKLDVFCYG